MIEELKDIRIKLENGIYKNEEHIRLSLVARVLQQLGWDIWNPNEVNTEFKVVPHEDYTRVDIALFLNPYIPSVFIEIKPVGKIDNELQKIEQQLRDYNRNHTAEFSIITDGRRWRFYYSQTGGEFSQKCFKILDFIKDDLDSLELSLKMFLSKSEVSNGNAKSEAENYLKLNLKQRAMEDALHKARRLVLESPFPSLPQAIINIVAEAGLRISLEESTQFVEQNSGKKFAPEPSVPSFSESTLFSYTQVSSYTERYSLEELVNLDLDKSKPDKLFIGNKEFKVGSWSDLSVTFVSWLIDEGLLTESSIPILSYSRSGDKYFVNITNKHKDPSKDAIWKEIRGFYVDTKYNAINHVKNLRSTLEQLKIKDPGIKISLRRNI